MEIRLDNGFAVLCYTQHDYEALKNLFPAYKWEGTAGAMSCYSPCAFYCFLDGEVTYSDQTLYEEGNRDYLPRVTLEDLRLALLNKYTRPAPPMRPCRPSEVTDVAPVVSDGKSTSYYRLKIKRVEDGQEFECEMGDIIASVVGNDFNLGNILKASRRMYEATQGRGKKDVSIRYDANKIGYFADDFAKRQGE